MKSGRKLKLLPAAVGAAVCSFALYVPGKLVLRQQANELSVKIQTIEREISELEEANAELSLEVEVLRKE
jgi:Tfp pilus assembly protein PilN